MIIIGKKGESRKDNGDSFKELQEFSGELIELGREIEEKLKEKQRIEGEIAEKEQKMAGLRKETFSLKARLVRLEIELKKLEQRRRGAKGNNQGKEVQDGEKL